MEAKRPTTKDSHGCSEWIKLPRIHSPQRPWQEKGRAAVDIWTNSLELVQAMQGRPIVPTQAEALLPTANVSLINFIFRESSKSTND